MKILLFICGLLLSMSLFQMTALAQELPDFRNDRESFKRLSDKGPRADLSTFTLAGVEESIGRNPLKKIAPENYTKQQLFFNGKDLTVTLTVGPFDKKGKKLLAMEDRLVKINNKPYYGNYGDTPVTEIKRFEVIMEGDTVAIPPAAYADLFNVYFAFIDGSGKVRTSSGLFFSVDGKRLYIYLQNRDRTGSYEVTWIIDNKKYLRRVLDYGMIQ